MIGTASYLYTCFSYHFFFVILQPLNVIYILYIIRYIYTTDMCTLETQQKIKIK